MNFDLCVEVAKDVFGVGLHGGRQSLKVYSASSPHANIVLLTTGESEIIVTIFYLQWGTLIS